ncbi:MAG: hypothetical protein JW828_09355 [Sedimentisphaerales bacterium]|nr:hypothetical protein [Sedimentisphaerales bacterium]
MVEPFGDNGIPQGPRVFMCRRRMAQITLLGCLILFFGIAIGWGLPYLVGPTPGGDTSKPLDEGMLHGAIQVMRDNYNLSEEQVGKLDKTMRKHFETLEEYRIDMEQKMEDLQAKLVVDLKAILDVEQFRKWREDIEKMRDRRGWRERPGGREGRGGPGGPINPGDWIRRMNEWLELNPQQKIQAEQIAKRYFDSFFKTESPEERGKLFEKMREEFNGILTEQQRAKMRQLMEQRQGRDGRGGPGSGDPLWPIAALQRAVEPLDLTEEQKQQVEQILQKYTEQVRTAESSENRRQLFETIRREVDAVLTEPQRQQMQQRLEPRPSRDGRGGQGPAGGPPGPREEPPGPPPDRNPSFPDDGASDRSLSSGSFYTNR